MNENNNKLNILYEDNHLIVAIKPAGILSQGDGSNRPDMLTILKAYIKEKYDKPGNVFLGLVHRLDLPVEGIMVFAKTSKAASRLSKQIREGQMIKRYIACVHGKLENKEGKLRGKILKGEGNIVFSHEDGKESSLQYKVLDYNEKQNLSLVDILLETGRTHQIRFLFSEIGHPLRGDMKYGKENKTNIKKEEQYTISLFAYVLEFDHPTTKEKIKLKTYPHWSIFKEYLKENYSD